MRTSKSRSKSVAKRVKDEVGGGLKSVDATLRATKMADKAQRKRNKLAKSGEADRTINTKLPKWLNSGKRGNGKTDRR
jgi:nucleolar GTP-binding protein